MAAALRLGVCVCGLSSLKTVPFLAVLQPIANVSVYLLDAAGEPVPHGFKGEMFIESPGLAIEYLEDPEKTADKFVMRQVVSSCGRAQPKR